MGDLPFRRVIELLQDQYADLTGHTSAIQEFDPEIWREIAGEIIASHTHVLLEGRDAVVYADSPVWAHSVNQRRLTLLDSMRSREFDVDAIRVRNKPPPPNHTNTRSERKPSPIPTSASYALEHAAMTVDHEALRLALLKLSRHGTAPGN
jgi:hypothetical protein